MDVERWNCDGGGDKSIKQMVEKGVGLEQLRCALVVAVGPGTMSALLVDLLNIIGGYAFDAIHEGVRCDKCKILPVKGKRWKSKTKYDYDLCDTCFKCDLQPADYESIKPSYISNDS